jgi:hypothetical protein
MAKQYCRVGADQSQPNHDGKECNRQHDRRQDERGDDGDGHEIASGQAAADKGQR